ncbi:calcium-binding protein [Kordiimonas sp.]|uniref:calcium-binding protein n=1 Tax=Kordiimonas sp. TaxID=1970157 RepID=UPI003A8EFB97
MKLSSATPIRLFTSIELSDGNDTVNGTAVSDEINGLSGNDVIDGLAGIDIIDGGSGNDTLYGGSDYDAINGGDGNDFIIGDLYFTVPQEIEDHYYNHLYVTETAPDSADWIRGGDGDDTIASGSWTHEYVASEGLGNPYGGALNFSGGTSLAWANDSVWGQGGNDQIHGGGTLGGGIGNDTITAVTDEHTVYGGAGDDAISSAYGSGLIFGGAGDDTIVAGFGADTIWGGAGDDLIYGDDSGDDTAINTFKFKSGHGNDTISSFSASHEVIDLSALDSRIDDFDALLAATAEVTPTVGSSYDYAFLITTGDGDSIIIQGQGSISLSDIDFIL